MKHNHYFKDCPYEQVDVYRIIEIFGVTDPCIQHALKKLLCSGVRGHKDQSKDIQDVIDTLERWKGMREEDNKIASSKVSPVTGELNEKSYKLWCETCEGVGSYDNRDFGVPREYCNANCPCPDCDGKGYLNEVVNVAEKQSPKDSSANVDIDSPDENWYPDDSGEWVETCNCDFQFTKSLLTGRYIEVLAKHERNGQSYTQTVKRFESWFAGHKDWGNRVAYKVVK